MSTVTVTATQARKDFFDLISAAMYGNQTTLITRNSKVAAKISPAADAATNWSHYKKTLQKLPPLLSSSDLQNITQARSSFKTRFSQW